MKKRLASLVVSVFTCSALLGGFTDGTALAKEKAKPDNNIIKARLEECLKDYAVKNQFNGSILIAKDDEVLVDGGYGMADFDKHIKNKQNTVFEIGSLTKQFTAAAILKLQENKALNVQDTLNMYIPDYPNGDKIKLHNLLNHTSGIPEYLDFLTSIDSGTHSYTVEELIQIFKNKPLDFETGTKFSYSNSNYILLGYIIEKVTGMKYEDYIQKNIIEPLKMKHTGFLNKEGSVKLNHKATGYLNITEDGQATKINEVEKTLPYAAGEICSTVNDLYKWNKALFSGKVINKESMNQMFTPYLGDYGYGENIIKNDDGTTSICHVGSIPGFISSMENNIDKNYVIIFTTNNEHGGKNLNNLYDNITKILYGEN